MEILGCATIEFTDITSFVLDKALLQGTSLDVFLQRNLTLIFCLFI